MAIEVEQWTRLWLKDNLPLGYAMNCETLLNYVIYISFSSYYIKKKQIIGQYSGVGVATPCLWWIRPWLLVAHYGLDGHGFIGIVAVERDFRHVGETLQLSLNWSPLMLSTPPSWRGGVLRRS